MLNNANIPLEDRPEKAGQTCDARFQSKMSSCRLLWLKLPAIVLLLAACREDPQISVEGPITRYIVKAQVPKFEPCDLFAREALERAEGVKALPSADCTEDMCNVTGQGYEKKEERYFIAALEGGEQCTLRPLESPEFTEFYTAEVIMNADYLRSLGLSRSAVEGLEHRHFAGSKVGELRGTYIDKLSGDVRVSLKYDQLPTSDEFLVSGTLITIEYPSAD
ncbi:hypothetical protein AB3Y40_09840 [Yoonia sp. R2331]|uniref:hypothetical protein n=1 Tax=Yoonia sp. R2331 TaxID=3237238 RepID=UPI0034E45480